LRELDKDRHTDTDTQYSGKLPGAFIEKIKLRFFLFYYVSYYLNHLAYTPKPWRPLNDVAASHRCHRPWYSRDPYHGVTR
jgi:hypothetical protein